MSAITNSKPIGPLVSAILMIILVTLTTMWPVFELIAKIGDISYLMIFPYYLVDAMSWGCAIYVGWYFILQKYQQDYPMWCYGLLPIVCWLINYGVTKLPFLEFIVWDKTNNLLFYVAILIMISLLVWQGIFLKRIAYLKSQQTALVIFTLLAVSLLVVACFGHVKGILSSVLVEYTSLTKLLPVISFLSLMGVLLLLTYFIKGKSKSVALDIVSIRFAFMLGVIGLDGGIINKVVSGGIYSYLTYILIAFFIVKIVYIWKYTKKLILPIQPLYILWSLLITTLFSSVIMASMLCLIIAGFYVWLSSMSSMHAEAAGWYMLFWIIPLPFIYPIINMLMTCFSLKLFFPIKTKLDS